MRMDPYGNSAQGGARRGGGIRWWVLLLFAGYAAYYWFSNRSTDPMTGEKVVIDRSLSAEDEKALGLQAYQEILQQERPGDQNSPFARQVREIAHALLRHGAQRMAQQRLAQLGQVAGAVSGMDAQTQQMVMSAYGYGMMLPYARSHETQADEVGLMLAAAACFNPQEAIPLWERMSAASGGQAPPEFASTHPNPGTRINNLQALMPKAMEYRAKYCEQAK